MKRINDDKLKACKIKIVMTLLINFPWHLLSFWRNENEMSIVIIKLCHHRHPLHFLATPREPEADAFLIYFLGKNFEQKKNFVSLEDAWFFVPIAIISNDKYDFQLIKPLFIL